MKTALAIQERDYDNLFIVQVKKAGSATMSHLHFGEMPGQ